MQYISEVTHQIDQHAARSYKHYQEVAPALVSCDFVLVNGILLPTHKDSNLCPSHTDLTMTYCLQEQISMVIFVQPLNFDTLIYCSLS